MMLLFRLGLDAAVLMFLLKTINDDDIEFATAFFVALASSIVTGLLVYGLGAALGIFGVLLAAVIAAVLLGVAVSALFGAEIKRSFIIGFLFVTIHVGVSMGMSAMFRA